MKNIVKLALTFPVLILFLAIPKITLAADLDFSIYPTLLKTTIKPGKSISQVVLITNHSSVSHSFIVRIVPFVPNDNHGNPELKPNYKPEWLQYFGLANATVFFNQPFAIEAGKSQQLTLTITIPETAPLSDYYATLLAISSDQLGPNDEIPNTQVSATIGMNILLTTSGQEFPQTSLTITKFSPLATPLFKLDDSTFVYDNLTPLEFSAIAKNIGRYLTEPRGLFKIAKGETPISLQPILQQNILANSERLLQASPSGNFTYTPSIIDIGAYTANLYLNSENASASSKLTFYLFPFKAGLGLLIGLVLLLALIKISKKPIA